MENICWQYQHLCLSFSSGTRTGSERAERCYTVSADLHYHMTSNRVSGCTPPHIWPCVSFITFTTAISAQSLGELLQGALSAETASSATWREEIDCNCSDFGLTALSLNPSADGKNSLDSQGCIISSDSPSSYTLCLHI